MQLRNAAFLGGRESCRLRAWREQDRIWPWHCCCLCRANPLPLLVLAKSMHIIALVPAWLGTGKQVGPAIPWPWSPVSCGGAPSRCIPSGATSPALSGAAEMSFKHCLVLTCFSSWWNCGIKQFKTGIKLWILELLLAGTRCCWREKKYRFMSSLRYLLPAMAL